MHRLRNPAVIGDLLVVVFAVLLVLAVVHRAEGVAAAGHHRLTHTALKARL